MAGRFRFSIASLLLLTLVSALLLAGVKAHPKASAMWNPSAGSSALAVWAALAHELVFLAIALSLVWFIGKRTRFEFALGFLVLAMAHWVLLNQNSFSTIAAQPNMLHSVLIEQWIKTALGGTKGTPNARAWTVSDLRLLLYAVETLVAGTLGGLYAMWLGRRNRLKANSAPRD